MEDQIELQDQTDHQTNRLIKLQDQILVDHQREAQVAANQAQDHQVANLLQEAQAKEVDNKTKRSISLR